MTSKLFVWLDDGPDSSTGLDLAEFRRCAILRDDGERYAGWYELGHLLSYQWADIRASQSRDYAVHAQLAAGIAPQGTLRAEVVRVCQAIVDHRASGVELSSEIGELDAAIPAGADDDAVRSACGSWVFLRAAGSPEYYSALADASSAEASQMRAARQIARLGVRGWDVPGLPAPVMARDADGRQVLSDASVDLLDRVGALPAISEAVQAMQVVSPGLPLAPGSLRPTTLAR